MTDKLTYDSTAPQEANIKRLGEYFRVRDQGDVYHLFCKKCDKGWVLAKDSRHPGNFLHLLNHAYSHLKK